MESDLRSGKSFIEKILETKNKKTAAWAVKRHIMVIPIGLEPTTSTFEKTVFYISLLFISLLFNSNDFP